MKNKVISLCIALVFLFTCLISADAIAPTPRIDLNEYQIISSTKSNINVSGTINISVGQALGVYDANGKVMYSYIILKNTGGSTSFTIQVPERYLNNGKNTFKIKSSPIRGEINGSNPKTLTVIVGSNKVDQSITASDVTVKVNEKKNLNAKSSSNLPLTYVSKNSSIATIDASGNVVGRAKGNTQIVISQSGNSTYNPTSKSINVNVTSASVPSTPASLGTPKLNGSSLYNNKVVLTWGKVASATSYEIYRNDKKIATVKTNSYRQIKLKKNSTYKYKVRAVGKVNNQTVYSKFSNVKSLKAKYRTPVLLMVDKREDNKRIPKAFKKYANVKVVTVYSYDKIDPSKYDGLIIPGGNNITPSLYGEKKHPSTHGTNLKNDKIQIEAVKRFVKAKKPVLGICRGNQIINVAFGGTIRQNLNLKDNDSVYQKKFHKVKNIKGYWMYSLFGKTKKTYQYHHQCVGKLGKGLVATSYSSGYKYKHIESIQHKTLPVYGIQWHPDSKITETKSQKVFTGFKKICLDNMAK